MTWTTADFRSYPARCAKFHHEAALSLQPLHIGAFPTYSAAMAEIQLQRKFRYLVRSQPGVDFHLDRILAEHEFRAKASSNNFGDWNIFLTAKPLTADELLTLNPDLAGILA